MPLSAQENQPGEMSLEGESFTLEVTGSVQRLDAWLAAQRPELSRARVQDLIKSGQILLNGRSCKPSHGARPGDRLEVRLPAVRASNALPEDIPLEVLYEDGDLLAVNKPAGLVTHPAPGHDTGTLVNALLHHCRDLGGIGGERRPGIVHRLDKDTTGVLVVAKNEAALKNLVEQFKNRQVHKEYLALVWGLLTPAAGTIETLLGRSTHDRKKMSARPVRGRVAVTHYETLETWPGLSLLRIRIETGRTHQIRVHMAHLGHPVVGDRQYGRPRNIPLPAPVERQLLHAQSLSLAHPRTGGPLNCQAPLPPDFQTLLDALRRGQAKSGLDLPARTHNTSGSI